MCCLNLMKIEFLGNPDQLRWRPKLNFLRVLVKSRRNKNVCGRVAVSVNYFIESGTPAHNINGGKQPVAFDETVSQGGEALARNLPVIVLTILLVMFPGGSTPARGATGALAAAGAGLPSVAVGDEEAAQGRERRRSRKRRNVKRGQRMSQPKDNAKPHEAGESPDAAGQKKVDEAKKTQPPAPRPRRRYDPVLQPPERTRVP
jgi:hypothetical protein